MCPADGVPESRRPPDAILLARLVSALPVALAVTRARDGCLLYANRRLGELFGAPAEKLLGESVRDFYVDSSTRREMLAVLDRDGEALDWPIEIRRRDGRVIRVMASIVPTSFGDEPRALLGILQDVTQRVEAESRRDEQLRLLLEATGEGILGFDASGRCTFANPAAARLLGREDPSELVGRTLHAVLHAPDEADAPAGPTDCEFCSETLAGRPAHADGEELARRDGSRFPAECWSHPIARSTGAGGSVVTFLDVTERRRAQELLAEKTAELAQAARFPEMNPGPVLRLGREGTVLRANQAAREVFGSDPVGRRWPDLVPEVDIGSAWQEIVQSTSPVSVDVAVGPREFVFIHRRDELADLVFVFGADITPQKRAERDLEEKSAALARMARFPEMNPGPVLRLDREGRILMANSAASEVFGHDLVGACWRDLLPQLAADETWGRVLAADEALSFEHIHGGREFVFVHRRDLEADLVFVFGTDVSAQKLAERALRQSEKMATLGTLAAGVAHELNNPAAATRRAAEQLRDAFERLDAAHLRLGSIQLSPAERDTLVDLDRRARANAERPNELDSLTRSDREAEIEEWLEARGFEEPWHVAPSLLGQGLSLEDLHRLASTLSAEALSAGLVWTSSTFPVYSLTHAIGEGSSRISEIVRALRSYSHLGEAPVQLIDVHEGLDDTLIILRSKLKRGVDVRREYAPGLPQICAYGSELNQVWTNLIDNAVDAMDGRGTIVLRTRQAGDRVEVEVEDDGPGIPEAIRPRVFDPFFTTKAPGFGTGLGLATSYGIVTEKHGGTMAVDSRPGRTRFTVVLPIEPPSRPPRAEPDTENGTA